LSPEARERQRLYWQEKNRRRRAAKRGGASEPYTLAEVAVRDDFRCGLCGDSVPMTVRVPDPLAPTTDHIVPVSKGGDDTRANVQLAHFRCNSVKGNRGSGAAAPAA
jgi:5-methylcytosine-specific restriction endonuclease McrA